LYSCGELFALAKEVPWAEFDLFHEPHYTLPIGIPVPAVVTIHDLTHVFHPQRWYYPLIAGPVIASAAIRAKRVVAVSGSARAELLRLFCGSGLIAKKVTIIPNSVQLTAAAEGVGHVSDTKPSYLLGVVSTNKPHKGVADLLQAFRSVGVRFSGWELRLVGYGIEPAAPVQVGGGAWIHCIGPVDDTVLAAQYAGARGVIVASKAEGFCIPVLEAHSVGVRVGARPVPAIQELMTESDIVARDLSAAALGSVCEALMTSPPPNVAQLKQHAAGYSIEQCTERLLKVYKEAVCG
jgi:glycosyltransferase involved in cell wall biosynthesis